MQADFDAYSSFTAVTPSDTTLVTCRAVYIGGAGNLTFTPGINAGAKGVGGATPTPVTFAVIAGATLRLALDQGLINATGTTATGIVALN